MPRLVPSPIGDIRGPLERIEAAIKALGEKLRPVDALPAVQSELEQVNETLAAILAVLEQMRDELGGAAAKRPAA
jgi:hypothetical protein